MLRYTQDKLDGLLKDDEYRSEYGATAIKSELAIMLTAARKSRNLSQRDLADLTNKSQAYIAKLESGEANPTIGHIGALLAAMSLRPRFALEPLVRAEPYRASLAVTGEYESATVEKAVAERRLPKSQRYAASRGEPHHRAGKVPPPRPGRGMPGS